MQFLKKIKQFFFFIATKIIFFDLSNAILHELYQSFLFIYMKNNKIAIFASGSGSNAENIINYFSDSAKNIDVTLILTNNKNAFVIERAIKYSIPYIVFDRNQFNNTNEIVEKLLAHKIDLVVLAGFLWLVPANLIKAFPNKIINIHPALLPKHGGKGMYGDKVHKTVIENKEKESGITIHYVNEEYDKGSIIHQSKCAVGPSDDAESLAQKVHKLEYDNFPKVIEELLNASST